MFDKTINVKTIDLSGVNLPSDDKATCDLIYSALSTTYGFPLYLENFKVNGVKHDSVLVNPIISENQTIINLNDCHLIVTPTDISVGKGVYGASLESIVDKNGNPRFVEGDITMETIEGVTQTYGKWSLSGTHLMIVIAFDIGANVSTPVDTRLALIEIPEFIINKITNIWANVINVVGVTIREKQSWWINSSLNNVILYKVDNHLAIRTSATQVTPTADSVCRIQFDLLIDSDYDE